MGGGHYTAVCKNSIDKKWYVHNSTVYCFVVPLLHSFFAYFFFPSYHFLCSPVPGIIIFSFPHSTISLSLRYNFNDSWVTETSPELAVNEQAYVLFYQRRTGALRWAGIEPLEGQGLPDEKDE